MGAVGIVEVGFMPARADIERVVDEHGVWLRPFGNYIYSMPPLVSSASAVERIALAMADLASSPPGPEPDDPDFHE